MLHDSLSTSINVTNRAVAWFSYHPPTTRPRVGYPFSPGPAKRRRPAGARRLHAQRRSNKRRGRRGS